MNTILTFMAVFLPCLLSAQSTFSDIQGVLQTNCTGTCHTSTQPDGGLDFTLPSADLYGALVNATPQNAGAISEGHKRVSPGYPNRSFLFRKLSHHLDGEEPLHVGEGDAMPPLGAMMDKADVELIRQWIFYGAPDAGVVVDKDVLVDFYSGLGKKRITPQSVPNSINVERVKLGPVILAPEQELEYYKKYDLQWLEGRDVTGIDLKMNLQSHHFIMFKYQDGTAPFVSDGFRIATAFTDSTGENLVGLPVAGWQFSNEHQLPTDFCYRWEQGTVIDLNMHVKNYDSDSVLAVDLYMDIYYEQENTVPNEMFSSFYAYEDEFGGNDWEIPNDATFHTLVMEQYEENSLDTIYMWMLQAHTHERGVDYNIWRRNVDGTKGEQVYDGSFDYENNFDTGIFDRDHPPIKLFEPFLAVPLAEGLIHEAIFYNDGPAPIKSGPTTADEMFVTFYQYSETQTSERPVSVIANRKNDYFYTHLFHSAQRLELFYSDGLEVTDVIITDLTGKVWEYEVPNYALGQTTIDISTFAKGVYTITVIANSSVISDKFLKY